LAVYLPVYMQATLGLSPGDTGLAMLGLLLGMTAGAGLSGRLFPRMVNYKRIAHLGLACALLGLGVLAYIPDQGHLLAVEPASTVIGIGIGPIGPVPAVAVQAGVDKKDLGIATRLLTFLGSLGGAIGVAALGAIALGNSLPLAGEGAMSAEMAG